MNQQKSITFTIYGHENLLATHPRTFEFTKDKHLTKQGDCIIGVNATFDLKEINKLHLKDNQKIKIILNAKNRDNKINNINKTIQDEIIAYYNASFTNNHEMVIRITEFRDQRTFAIKANKSSLEINRKLIDELKSAANSVEVQIEIV